MAGGDEAKGGSVREEGARMNQERKERDHDESKKEDMVENEEKRNG